jgi:hypothetical protein
MINVLVPGEGVEPTRGCPQQLLRLPRLPFRHPGVKKQNFFKLTPSILYSKIEKVN